MKRGKGEGNGGGEGRVDSLCTAFPFPSQLHFSVAGNRYGRLIVKLIYPRVKQKCCFRQNENKMKIKKNPANLLDITYLYGQIMHLKKTLFFTSMK